MKKVSIEMQARSACDCFQVANTSLELARRAKEDWERDHHCITGITFTAFSIEAMINHFGCIYEENWNELKMGRKELHRRLFNHVNLKGYLGTTNYHNAQRCFVMRDAFAHGKTLMESAEVELSDFLDGEEAALQIATLKTASFRAPTFDLFELFIKSARQIERDIQANGFYPNTSGHPNYQPQPLRECPLSVTGIRMW